MTIWGKLYRLFTVRRCAMCHTDLTEGQRGTCSSQCEKSREEMALW